MIGSIKDGQILNTDLCDSQGSLLLQAGLPVTDALIRGLADLGIREVYLDDTRGKKPTTTELELAFPYDPTIERQLEHNYLRMTAALSGLADELRVGGSTSTDELEEIIISYLQLAIKDSGVVLANCMGLDAQENDTHDPELQRRSVRMAILAEKAPAAQKEFMASLRQDSYIKISETYRPLVAPILFADERKEKTANK